MRKTERKRERREKDKGTRLALSWSILAKSRDRAVDQGIIDFFQRGIIEAVVSETADLRIKRSKRAGDDERENSQSARHFAAPSQSRLDGPALL